MRKEPTVSLSSEKLTSFPGSLSSENARNEVEKLVIRRLAGGGEGKPGVPPGVSPKAEKKRAIAAEGEVGRQPDNWCLF